ncbi:MAG: hypothetical protein AMS17_10925 [Spirochaetes bacterium DG_61]|nr:MAG: hypothetical protein AMS17_10925 [Spirochaetes bacterium DG_61]
MKDETVILKSDLLDLTKARKFVTRLAQEARAGGTAVTKVEVSCDEWNAVIREHALKDGVWKRFTIECNSSDGKFMTIYLQSRALDVFELLGFTKFYKRAMDTDGAMVLIKGESQEVTSAEEIDDPDSEVFPFMFQCPQCGKQFKTSIPPIQVL